LAQATRWMLKLLGLFVPVVRIRQRTQLGDRFEAVRVEDFGAKLRSKRVLIRLPTTLMAAPA
jgi:hypothetical protein